MRHLGSTERHMESPRVHQKAFGTTASTERTLAATWVLGTEETSRALYSEAPRCALKGTWKPPLLIGNHF